MTPIPPGHRQAPFPDDEMEEVTSCLVCGHDEVTRTLERGVGLRVHECAACGFAYVSPRPKWTAILRHYEHDYANEWFDQQWRDSVAFDIQRADVRRVESLLDLQGAAVLDVGCGPGLFLEALQRRGAGRLAGIEPGLLAAEFAKSRLPSATILRTTFENADSTETGTAFALVVGFELVEHLYDPRRFVRWARDRLVNGGLLYLKTPNWGAVQRYGATWEGLWRDFEHVHYFSRATLGTLLDQEGFDVIAAQYEPYRCGLGGTTRIESAGGTGHARQVARRAIKSIPGMNRLAYASLQSIRAWKSREDVRAGTAHGLALMARRR